MGNRYSHKRLQRNLTEMHQIFKMISQKKFMCSQAPKLFIHAPLLPALFRPCSLAPKNPYQSLASESQHKIRFETAFKTGQINNSDGMSELCFPHPCIARFFHGCFNLFVGKTNKTVALRPRFRFPRSHDSSDLLTNR